MTVGGSGKKLCGKRGLLAKLQSLLLGGSAPPGRSQRGLEHLSYRPYCGITYYMVYRKWYMVYRIWNMVSIRATAKIMDTRTTWLLQLGGPVLGSL